ncbi:hypothetical protein Y1Q_0014997 [Alligator mississippiensis]|uniref:Uncharacterized protein n=1 Tax=Alligator mississippiensis TaxID=8496 RepID=A0A151N8Z4_ALLMI|nr:hypothetical protein Y1Q_0014997 [Alligator mississippiensis]
MEKVRNKYKNRNVDKKEAIRQPTGKGKETMEININRVPRVSALGLISLGILFNVFINDLSSYSRMKVANDAKFVGMVNTEEDRNIMQKELDDLEGRSNEKLDECQ